MGKCTTAGDLGVSWVRRVLGRVGVVRRLFVGGSGSTSLVGVFLTTFPVESRARNVGASALVEVDFEW